MRRFVPLVLVLAACVETPVPAEEHAYVSRQLEPGILDIAGFDFVTREGDIVYDDSGLRRLAVTFSDESTLWMGLQPDADGNTDFIIEHRLPGDLWETLRVPGNVVLDIDSHCANVSVYAEAPAIDGMLTFCE